MGKNGKRMGKWSKILLSVFGVFSSCGCGGTGCVLNTYIGKSKPFIDGEMKLRHFSRRCDG